MDDQNLEARLKTYRPAGPPAQLRARVVPADAGRGRRRALPWLPAVAAMLLATVFYWLASSDRARLFAQFPTVDAGETIEWQLENQP